MDPTFKTHGIFGLEQLTEATVTAGYQVEFRQLYPGELLVDTWTIGTSRGWLQYLSSNIAVEAQGGMSSRYYSLLVPVDNMVLNQNGVVANEGEWVLLRAGAESLANNALSSAGGLLLVYIPSDIFEPSIRSLSKVGVPNSAATRLRPNFDQLYEFSRLVQAWRQAPCGFSFEKICAEFSQLLVDAMLETGVISPRNEKITPARRVKVLRRCREYIEAHLAEPMLISQLCKHAGISHRSLCRIFQGALQLTPQSYIKLRRLHNVRNDLLDSNNRNRSVTDIAATHGITHMGRFSLSFKKHFGISTREFRKAVKGGGCTGSLSHGL